jgi:DNA-binding MarR family transcriptional regulator
MPYTRRITLLQLLRLSKRCGHLLEVRLEPLGLTRSQGRALTALAERGEMTAKELLPPVCVEPASMTRLLQDLESDGLVERRPHPTDGRSSILSLTGRGREAQREVMRIVEEADAAVMVALSEEESEHLKAALGRLSEHLDRLDARRIHGCAVPDGNGTKEEVTHA